MSKFPEGARVEVYDDDRKRWCPGTVQSTWKQTALTEAANIPLDELIVIRSDDEIVWGLPLTWAVPVSEADQFIRLEEE